MAVQLLKHRLSHGQTHLEIGAASCRTGRAPRAPPRSLRLPLPARGLSPRPVFPGSHLLPISKQTRPSVPCLWTRRPLSRNTLFPLTHSPRSQVAPGSPAAAACPAWAPAGLCPRAPRVGLCHVTVGPSGPPRARALPAPCPGGVCNVMRTRDASAGRAWARSPVPFRFLGHRPAPWAPACL